MIDGMFVNTDEFNTKGDKTEAYKDFLERMYINAEDFPFTVKTGKMFKGKPVTFTVSSWGYYETARGDWRIYVCYRFNAMKHIVQYTWHVGAGGLAFGNPEKYEWIGG